MHAATLHARSSSARRDRAWAGAGWLLAAVLLLPAGPAQAGLFDDEEARKAILDLRNRINSNDDAAKSRHAELAQTNAQLLEQMQQLRRSILDLNGQIEAQRADNAKLRGTQEQLVRDNAQLAKDLADQQRKLKDSLAAMDERFKKLEPLVVSVDGKDFSVEPEEKRGYEASLATLRTGDFDKGAAALTAFVRRYPSSGYIDSARFWLANALYGQKKYRDAIEVFRAMVASSPDHPRAAEALLGIANCQVEMKDVKTARKTLEELVKAYPASEAAAAAKERMGSLKG